MKTSRMKTRLRSARSGALAPLLRTTILAAAAFAVAGTVAAPAFAEDDGHEGMLSSFMNIVGIKIKHKPETADPKIDYHERASIVLPRAMNLPPPAHEASSRNPLWPHDPDVIAAQHAADLARAPAQQPGQDTAMNFASMAKDRTDVHSLPGYDNCEMNPEQCDPHKLWASLRVKKGDPNAIPSSSQPAMVAGKEPPRVYLTQPPPGYMAPTATIKRSFEPQKSDDDSAAVDNPNVYYMQQAGHKVNVDDAGSN